MFLVGADRRIRPKKTSTHRADTLICPYNTQQTEINIIIIISRNFYKNPFNLRILISKYNKKCHKEISLWHFYFYRSTFIVNRSSFIVQHSTFIVQRSSFNVHRSSFIVHRSTKLQQSQLTDEIKHAISDSKAYNTYDKTNLNHIVLLDEVG